MENIKFLTVPEVADILQLDKMNIYRYIKRGKLEAYLFGKGYRIEADFKKFLLLAEKDCLSAVKKHNLAFEVRLFRDIKILLKGTGKNGFF